LVTPGAAPLGPLTSVPASGWSGAPQVLVDVGRNVAGSIGDAALSLTHYFTGTLQSGLDAHRGSPKKRTPTDEDPTGKDVVDEELKRSVSSSDNSGIEASDNVHVAALKKKKNALMKKIAEMGKDHPDLEKARKEVQQLDSEITEFEHDPESKVNQALFELKKARTEINGLVARYRRRLDAFRKGSPTQMEVTPVALMNDWNNFNTNHRLVSRRLQMMTGYPWTNELFSEVGNTTTDLFKETEAAIANSYANYLKANLKAAKDRHIQLKQEPIEDPLVAAKLVEELEESVKIRWYHGQSPLLPETVEAAQRLKLISMPSLQTSINQERDHIRQLQQRIDANGGGLDPSTTHELNKAKAYLKLLEKAYKAYQDTD
jgi:hypothetical protein